MQIIVKRDTPTATSTPGRLFVVEHGKERFVCYTLEDIPRAVKIPGQTAIPVGEYQVTISHSARFKRQLPLLHAVPNFTGIRIHGGNTHENTEGCILVARDRVSPDRIRNCAPALAQVMTLINAAAARREPVTICIESHKP